MSAIRLPRNRRAPTRSLPWWLGIGLRIILGLLFLASGSYKAVEFNAFLMYVRRGPVFIDSPMEVAGAAIGTLIVLEIFVGLWWLMGRSVKVVAVSSSVFLVVVTAFALVKGVRAGLPCHCTWPVRFLTAETTEELVIRNSVLLALIASTVVLCRVARTRLSVRDRDSDPSPSGPPGQSSGICGDLDTPANAPPA